MDSQPGDYDRCIRRYRAALSRQGISRRAASHSLTIAKNKNPRPATHRCGYLPWHVLMRQLGIDDPAPTLVPLPEHPIKMHAAAIDKPRWRPWNKTDRTTFSRDFGRVRQGT
jgi:hypothetical protein